MKRVTVLLTILTIVIAAGTATAGLDKHLEVFEPYVGKTLEGAFVNSATGESSVDVQRWEATLGGKAIRVVHSLNEGEYGNVHLKSEFLKDGKWVPGHEIYYVEAPDAKVVFK